MLEIPHIYRVFTLMTGEEAVHHIIKCGGTVLQTFVDSCITGWNARCVRPAEMSSAADHVLGELMGLQGGSILLHIMRRISDILYS